MIDAMFVVLKWGGAVFLAGLVVWTVIVVLASTLTWLEDLLSPAVRWWKQKSVGTAQRPE